VGSTTTANVKLSNWQDEVPGDDCCLFFSNTDYDYDDADPRWPDSNLWKLDYMSDVNPKIVFEKDYWKEEKKGYEYCLNGGKDKDGTGFTTYEPRGVNKFVYQSYKCGKNAELELEGYPNFHLLGQKNTRPHLYSAGEVSNADFGYWRDSVRGRVARITIKPYDEDVFRKVTLFDYEDCMGHSAIFEEARQGYTNSTYETVARVDSVEENDAESIMVPKGLQVELLTGRK